MRRSEAAKSNEPQYTEAQEQINKIDYLDMVEAGLSLKERVAFMEKRDIHFIKTGELLTWKPAIAVTTKQVNFTDAELAQQNYIDEEISNCETQEEIEAVKLKYETNTKCFDTEKEALEYFDTDRFEVETCEYFNDGSVLINW